MSFLIECAMARVRFWFYVKSNFGSRLCNPCGFFRSLDGSNRETVRRQCKTSPFKSTTEFLFKGCLTCIFLSKYNLINPNNAQD